MRETYRWLWLLARVICWAYFLPRRQTSGLSSWVPTSGPRAAIISKVISNQVFSIIHEENNDFLTMLSISKRYVYLFIIELNLPNKCFAVSSNISSAFARSLALRTCSLKQWYLTSLLHASRFPANGVFTSGFVAPFWSIFSCCSNLYKREKCSLVL